MTIEKQLESMVGTHVHVEGSIFNVCGTLCAPGNHSVLYSVIVSHGKETAWVQFSAKDVCGILDGYIEVDR
jgi:hypothetical protein